MKKLLLSVAMLAGITTANAQLADGSIAPNFTVTDIDGNSHTLYDYLDQGYTVILDISATWCGPCWSYHNSGALEDLYAAHGPAGAAGVSGSTTDDVMVLWVEGDGSTPASEIYGGGSSQGDWTLGGTVEFPLIDAASIASSYAIGYYPTVYTICPNRTLTESGQLSATAHYANVGSCPVATGTNNGGLIAYNGVTETCGDPVDVVVTLQNLGSANLTAATIEVFDGATSLLSYNWSGNLTTYQMEEVTVGSVAPSATTNYTIKITSADDNASDNTYNQTISYAVESSTLDVTVNIVTDAYGSETTWTLKSGSGATVASGGPYNDLASSGTTTQTPVNVSLNLADCYTMTVNDSWGDGMDSGYGAGYWNIKDGSGTTLVSGGDFLSQEKGVFRTSTVGIEENELAGVNVFPNPTSGIINITNLNNEENTIEIRDIAGKVVYSSVANATVKVDLTDNAAGVYFVKVSNEAGSKVVKVTLK